jgi:hypothetical protein
MNVSELIADLKLLLEQHGDLPVEVDTNEGWGIPEHPYFSEENEAIRMNLS